MHGRKKLKKNKRYYLSVRIYDIPRSHTLKKLGYLNLNSRLYIVEN